MKNHCIIFVLGKAIIFSIKEETACPGVQSIRNAQLLIVWWCYLGMIFKFLFLIILDSGSEQCSLLVDRLYKVTAFSSLFTRN